MGLIALGLALVFLLVLNAFFVLAEFAIVKVRPSRVAQFVSSGDGRAVLLTQIQDHLDEYLSVCQVGITLASVGLGMVGEKAAELIMGTSGSTLRYAAAMGVSYMVISGSHILLGELVPKSIAIRVADISSLACARPLRFFHRLFFPALWALTWASNLILRLFGVRPATEGEHHTEEELRIILEKSQERGLMSFRRLLYMENVFDLGALTVRDAMRVRAQVRTLDPVAPWKDNLAVIQATHFTRYPLLSPGDARPFGFIHVKDLVIRGHRDSPDLRAMARALLTTTETAPLETVFAEMQRRRVHVALVIGVRGEWTGILTLEDVMEELVGTIRDEFEDDEPARLSDAIAKDHIFFDIEANSPADAVRIALERMPSGALSTPASKILEAVEIRERSGGTYIGHGIALPHARIVGLARPIVLVLLSKTGVSVGHAAEKGFLLFVLLTPAGQPRIHQRLLATIATLLHESNYVKERLMGATSADEVLEVIQTGEQAVLD